MLMRFGLVLIVCLTLASVAVPQDTGKVSAIKANLRSTPSSQGSVVTIVNNGETFELIKDKAPWYLIQTSKHVGWIHGHGIKFIDFSALDALAAEILAEKKPPVRRPDPGAKKTNAPQMSFTVGGIVETPLSPEGQKLADQAYQDILGKYQHPATAPQVQFRVGGAVPDAGLGSAMSDEEAVQFEQMFGKKPVRRSETTALSPTVSPAPRVQPAAPPAVIRYETGTNLIREQGLGGLGVLQISNGTNLDAIAKLVDNATGRTFRLVYIQASSVGTIKNIQVGNYVLKFSLGTAYDLSAGRFTKAQRFSRFDDVLGFYETRVGTQIRWKRFEVTLDSVISGNASTSPISEADFEDQ